MSKRKHPDARPHKHRPASTAPTENPGATLDSAAHTAPDGSVASEEVERERPAGEHKPADAGRGTDANVNDPGRALPSDVESESDADNRSRRRDLGP